MIAVSGLTLRFGAGTPDERVALDALDLTIGDGEFVTVVGTNGAGKSTLLQVIAGNYRPECGRIVVANNDLTDAPVHRRACAIARVFQDPAAGTVASLTIEENLSLAARRGQRRGFRPALNNRKRALCRDLLASFQLGLEDRLQTLAGALSGGQKQVVALAMATIGETKLLLLDEHTAALDPRTAHIVMQVTAHLVERRRITTMMVTHNLRQALDHGSRLLMMEAGRIKLDLKGAAKSDLTSGSLLAMFGLDRDDMVLGAGG